MSYDIYLYKSKSGQPDVDEANDILDELESGQTVQDSEDLKQKICKALIEVNPRLSPFVFDYHDIARLQKISVEEARQKFNHIELNTPEDDIATQIIIYDNCVTLTIPYWYSGDKATNLFDTINHYLKIIHKTSGFFVYDPQTGSAFNPLEKSLEGQNIYEQGSAHIDKLRNESNVQTKPWWKFW